MLVLPIHEIVDRLIRFYYLHGHTDVPVSYKVDVDLAKAIRQLKMMSATRNKKRIEFTVVLRNVLPAATFGKNKKARQYLTSSAPKLDMYFSSENQKDMYKLIMWLTNKMWELHGQKKSRVGLVKFQGVNRGWSAQYLFKGHSDENPFIAGTNEENRKARKAGPNCWTGIPKRNDQLFFARIFTATEHLVSDHVGFRVALHTALFLGKCSLDNQSVFQKHIDDHDNKMAGFVGAISLVVADSNTHSNPGGVVVFPHCEKTNQKCRAKKHNTCNHDSEELRINFLESVFVPNDMFHMSLYPEDGTQLNLIMFFVRSDGNKKRGGNRTLNHASFSKKTFIQRWETVAEHGVKK